MIQQIKTISEFHQFRGLPKPEHPLVSLINFESIRHHGEDEPKKMVNQFYSIALKRNFNGKVKYGQQEYDFDSGIMVFIAPGQVFSIETEGEIRHSGWLLLFHPDLLWGKPLAKKIGQYEYFGYSVNEALHLSEKEEGAITAIMGQISQEYQANIDAFSQDLIVTQLELLLTYSQRFYNRQFLTRKMANHGVLDRLAAILNEYFDSGQLEEKGVPTVTYVSQALNISPGYLGSLLKVLTGQSTQQHIHHHLIEKAKEKLSTSDLSVSEIAYQLGFEHPQSFSKLFKAKTNQSPQDFRRSFN